MKHPRTPKPERIQQGRAYLYYGKPYRVGMLNECRARLDPLFRDRRDITSRLHDFKRTIYAKAHSLNIAPNCELPPLVTRCARRPDPKPAPAPATQLALALDPEPRAEELSA